MARGQECKGRNKKKKKKRRRRKRKKKAGSTEATGTASKPLPETSAATEPQPKSESKPSVSKTPAADADAPTAPAADADAPTAPVTTPTVPTGLPPPPPLRTEFRAVAILPPQARSVEEDVVRDVETVLYNEVDEREGVRAISPRDVQTALLEYRLDVAACDGGLSCLAQSARYARAHWAIETRLATIGGTLNVSLRLIDAEAGTELRRVAESVSHNPEERSQELHRLLIQLLAPETYVGSLTINSAVEGAEIYLDDHLVGTTPLEGPLADLAAGPHILKVSKPGFSDLNRFVDVAYNRNTTITVDLDNTMVSGVLIEIQSAAGFGSIYVAANISGIEIRIDGERRGVTPLSEAITEVPAGSRHVSFRKEGMRPDAKEVEIPAGKRVDIGVTVEDTKIAVLATTSVQATEPLPTYDAMAALAPRPVPAASIREPSWRWTAGLVAGGLAVGSVGAWSYFGYRVEQKEKAANDAIDKLRSREYSAADYETKRQKLDTNGKALESRAWLSLGSAVAMGVLGGGLIVWELLRSPEPTTEVTPGDSSGVSVTLLPTPQGGAVTLTGDW